MSSQGKSVLFICKERGYQNQSGSSYGLINSCKFVANYLNDIEITANVIKVVDNNDIDREVTKFKPDIVFIEALWVVPEKFKVLSELHPTIEWIVRIHSKAPFLSQEGIAIEWIKQYIELSHLGINIKVSVNNDDFFHDLKEVISPEIIYLPNIYYPKYKGYSRFSYPEGINLGCFGALRVPKNHLQQAIAAIEFANEIGQTLNFHINESKIERESGILNNLINLFKGTEHNLILHDWVNHRDFLDIVNSMDIGLQVSFTESFNIVSADFVHQDVPIVVSEDIKWMPNHSKAKAANTKDIVDKLLFIYKTNWLNLHKLNKVALKSYNKKAEKVWRHFLNV